MIKQTMRDVARLAGVSVATVSAVINSSATVSEARTKRVRDAMEALDYYPDQVARSLKVGRTNVVGMVVPDITNNFFPQLIRGAEDAARQLGYSVILCDSNEDPEEERRHLDTLFSRRVDGVLIACSDPSAGYEHLMRRRFPIVFVDRIPRGVIHGGVATDNVEAGARATNHLIDLGHERIAFITGKLGLSPHYGRLEGFRKAMQARGLPIRDEYLRAGDLEIETGRRLGIELLSLIPPPTAIISTNNRMLLGLAGAFAELGIPCPERISVVGFDDSVWTEHFNPGMTVMAQPAFEIGKAAFSMLIRKVRTTDDAPSEQPGLQLFPAQLRVRGSTAPPQIKQDSDSGQLSPSRSLRKMEPDKRSVPSKETELEHS
jgi:LacI family transcriptional regulator